jgi:hypothetical protein
MKSIKIVQSEKRNEQYGYWFLIYPRSLDFEPCFEIGSCIRTFSALEPFRSIQSKEKLYINPFPWSSWKEL